MSETHHVDESHYSAHEMLVAAARSGAMGEGPVGYMHMTPEERAKYKEARAVLWGALYGAQGYGKGMQVKRRQYRLLGTTTGRMSVTNPNLHKIPMKYPDVHKEARAKFEKTFCKFNYEGQKPKKEDNDKKA